MEVLLEVLADQALLNMMELVVVQAEEELKVELLDILTMEHSVVIEQLITVVMEEFLLNPQVKAEQAEAAHQVLDKILVAHLVLEETAE